MTEHALPNLAKLAQALANGDHRIFAPSSSAMWLYCSGSLIPNVLAPDRSSPEAAEGTVAHMVGETWLRSGDRPDHLLETTQVVKEKDGTYEIHVDMQMFDHVQRYVDWCYGLPGDHYIETRVDFSDLTPIPGQSGTADHAVCLPGLLTITDLKYGKGEKVYAERNSQGLLYAYGFFREWDWLYDFQEVLIRICQPRLDHFDEYRITRAELLEFGEFVKVRAKLAWANDAARTPGEKQCRWCKVRENCAARAVWVARLTDGVFDDLDAPVTAEEMQRLRAELDEEPELSDFKMAPPHFAELTMAQMARLLPYRGAVEKFFKDIDECLEKLALDGKKIPGHKLVVGRSNRFFPSETRAIEHLELIGLDMDTICPRTLISPAQAEEELRKLKYKRASLPDLLKSVVKKAPGKPTLVRESDPRKEINLVDPMFGNLDDDL